MNLRSRLFAGVAGSALIAGTLLFGSSPAGAITPGSYDWNTKCESVSLSLSIGTAIGVVGGGTGSASETYTANGYCGTYVHNTAFTGTEVVQLPNGSESDGLQEVNRKAQWDQFQADLGVIRARIVGNFGYKPLGELVADKVVDAFVTQNNELFGGLPTHVKGTRHSLGLWTSISGQFGLWAQVTHEDTPPNTDAPWMYHTIQPGTGALWSTDPQLGYWSGNGYADVVGDTTIFAAGCGTGRTGGQDGGGNEYTYGTYWKAIMAAGCNITVANSEGGLTVLGGIGMSYKAHVVGGPAS